MMLRVKEVIQAQTFQQNRDLSPQTLAWKFLKMISATCAGQPNFQDKPKSKDKGKKKNIQKGNMMYTVITVCLLISCLLSSAVLLL